MCPDSTSTEKWQPLSNNGYHWLNQTRRDNIMLLTSQTEQCHRVSTCPLHILQVYTKASLLELCISCSIAIVLNLVRRRVENSQCFSLAMVRKASRPSMRSHDIWGSGSLTTSWRARACVCSFITKNTSRYFSMDDRTYRIEQKNERWCH